MTRDKIAIIIGAGPAGLTAAYELQRNTKNIKPIIFESSNSFGGISKTVNYKGNRIDIGGHRFFSKSERIMKWWEKILPTSIDIPPRKNKADINDKTMLIRQRLSRIFFLRKFFDYPITLNFSTLFNLGLIRTIAIGGSYIKAIFPPIKPEKSLEDFFINRFGKKLYQTFFRDYTEKVWGVPCSKISPEWGAQRIKGLSIRSVLMHFIKQYFYSTSSIAQKNTETSLIQRFLYPKFGPGQMWEEVAAIIQEQGTKIYLNHEVVGLKLLEGKVVEIIVKNFTDKKIETYFGDYFFSTMPVKQLIENLQPPAPPEVLKVAHGLMYRDFITVGLLVKKLKIHNKTNIKTPNNIIPDNWIYIQEPEVKIGRLQIFNNWSPYLVNDPDTVWIGLEYFCSEGDDLWDKTDSDFIRFAEDELIKIDIIEKQDILDSTIIKIKKAYPAYFGTYKDFNIIRSHTDSIGNLFLIGRNGMHRYNNQDHSMLTAMVAVENIINGVETKDNLWNINIEQNYNETS